MLATCKPAQLLCVPLLLLCNAAVVICMDSHVLHRMGSVLCNRGRVVQQLGGDPSADYRAAALHGRQWEPRYNLGVFLLRSVSWVQCSALTGGKGSSGSRFWSDVWLGGCRSEQAKL